MDIGAQIEAFDKKSVHIKTTDFSYIGSHSIPFSLRAKKNSGRRISADLVLENCLNVL